MKSFIFYFLLICFIAPALAQQNIYRKITSLHTDFQKYADTTFIMQKTNNWDLKPDYFILSKKNVAVNIYFYGDVTKSIKIPPDIKASMKRINFDQNKLKAIYNVLFYPVAIPQEDALNFWKKITLLKPWEINDDEKNQYCTDPTIKLIDGGSITLFVITKNEIKSFYFPSPEFYEEKCPGNEQRKSILKIEEIYKSYFKF